MRVLLCIAALTFLGCSPRKSPNYSKSTATDAVTGIKTQALDIDRDHDGISDSRMESVQRHGVTVLRRQLERTTGTNLTVVSRTFYAGGRSVMIESDEDRDGVFESIISFRKDTDQMEVFHRASDGTITPASDDVLAAYKRQHQAFSQFFSEGMATNKTKPELKKMIRQTRSEVQAAQRDLDDAQRER